MNEILLKCKNDENQEFVFNLKIEKQKDKSVKINVNKKNSHVSH